jgi:putative PEP-CTERM system TPR-repeat lipoprotein
MAKAVPNDLRARYLGAAIALRGGQASRARDEIQQVLRSAPDHLPSHLLAGAIELELGGYRAAEEHFRRVLSREPAHAGARSFLVTTLLRSGDATRAEDALAPALRNGADDVTVQRLAGEVALANGDVPRAIRYYDRAAELEQASPELRARLAQLRFAAGDVERGVKELEAVARLDPGGYQADVALVALHLRRGERDRALAAARAFAKRQPANPLAHNLIGTVHLARTEPAAARTAYVRALEVEPTFLPAARNLARLDLDERRPDAARARFASILERAPGNEGALLSLAELESGLGADPADVIALLDRAVAAHPASVTARTAQVDYYLRRQEPRAAVAAARAGAAANPQDARLLELVGTAQLAAGDPQQAATAFTRLADLQPEAPAPWVRLAQAHAAARNYDAAMQALRKAIALRPAAAELARELVALQLAAGRLGEALQEARAMQRARPRDPTGYALEGEIHLAQQKGADALAPYREALRREGGAAAVIGLHRAALAAGRTEEGDRAVAEWQQRFPQDTLVAAYLADGELRRRRPSRRRAPLSRPPRAAAEQRGGTQQLRVGARPARRSRGAGARRTGVPSRPRQRVGRRYLRLDAGATRPARPRRGSAGAGGTRRAGRRRDPPALRQGAARRRRPGRRQARAGARCERRCRPAAQRSACVAFGALGMVRKTGFADPRIQGHGEVSPGFAAFP